MKKSTILLTLSILFTSISPAKTQSRIDFNDQKLFLSGANFAWIDFARDIGPGTTNFDRFKEILTAVHINGGNAMRLWLHTTGINTPEFDASGLVMGPGEGAIEDMKRLSDIARESQVGIIACLWSFDMLNTRDNPSSITDRNYSMLTDTTFLNAFIQHSLIPMVKALKGHPALIAWEIFNEPEGMSNEHGWQHTRHVPMADIQRFVNRCAGAIHRNDSLAQVTNGTWTLIAQSDVDDNHNYYRDDRLIAAGGDPEGTLDFYCVHYYNWIGKIRSPFHHPKSYWKLNKPLVVAEFAIKETFGVAGDELYRTLYDLGYAGALAWSFTAKQHSSEEQILASTRDIKTRYPDAVNIKLKAGTILSFDAAPLVLKKGQPGKLFWRTVPGSVVTLNGKTVNENDSLEIAPVNTTTYQLLASGDVTDSREITIDVLLPGRIVFFNAAPGAIHCGDSTCLSWHTVAGSSVTLNGIPVAPDDSMRVKLFADSTFTLAATGEVKDTSTIFVKALKPHEVNRALNRPAMTSSTETDSTGNKQITEATDGNLKTRWSSAWKDNQWLYVDLGRQFQVQRVVLNWELAYAQDYRIEISDNARQWTQIYRTDSGDGGIDDIRNIQGTGRYVRMFGKKRATNWGFSLWEFEVYGIPVVENSEKQ